MLITLEDWWCRGVSKVPLKDCWRGGELLGTPEGCWHCGVLAPDDCWTGGKLSVLWYKEVGFTWLGLVLG